MRVVFRVIVSDVESVEQAERVMRERMYLDADYGFTYTLSYELERGT